MEASRHKQQVGDRLRLVIEALDISNAEAARIMKVSPSQLGNWLRGDHYPSLIPLLRLKDRFGITLDYLFSDSVVGLPKGLADDLREAEEEVSEE